jgi:hypothetical protein
MHLYITCFNIHQKLSGVSDRANFIFEKKSQAECQWLTPVILATQRSGGSGFEANLSKWYVRPYFEKNLHKKGLVEWLKV